MKNLFLFFIVSTPLLYSQNFDITEALNEIENGNIAKAEKVLKEYKNSNALDPSVLFLDACLTTNGEDALKKYLLYYEKYPKHKYADNALYKIFSYYYSIGLYKNAENYLSKLKTEFPESVFIKLAERNISSINFDYEKQNKFIFTIQAGAFINYENAKKLCDRLNNDDLQAFITTKEIGGSTFNIVNCGKFDSETAANKLLNKLEKNYNIKGRVVQFEDTH